MRKFALLIALIILPVPVLALEGAVPGKSEWSIPLNMSRTEATRILKSRFMLSPRPAYSESVVGKFADDIWAFPHVSASQGREHLEMLSRSGKVVQLSDSTSGDQTQLSFAQLIQRHQLRKSVYSFDAPDGGGYVCFYYDDVKRGVCFTLDVQDDFLLTYQPNTIIIHKPGIAAIPIEGGILGKPVDGPPARAFANAKEATRVKRKEQNDY